MSSTIVIGFDPGSSLTKVVYQVNGEHRKRTLWMEPHVITVPLSRIKSAQPPSDCLSQDDAWIRTAREKENQAVVVGFKAQQLLSGLSQQQYGERKYESALYKILAAVGIISERHQLSSPAVSLSVLLPYGEWSSRQQLRYALNQCLSSFLFRGMSINASLSDWSCLPESSGLRCLAQKAINQEQKVVALMFGHRNTSCVVHQRGLIIEQQSNSTQLGFHQLVDSIAQRTAIPDTYQLTQKLCKLRDQDIEISALVESDTADYRTIESRLIQTAIRDCTEEYWALLETWLTAQSLKSASHILIGGGGARYLETHLRDYFPHQVEQVWGESHVETIKSSLKISKLPLSEGQKNFLAIRLIDVYGVFSIVSSSSNSVSKVS